MVSKGSKLVVSAQAAFGVGFGFWSAEMLARICSTSAWQEAAPSADQKPTPTSTQKAAWAETTSLLPLETI
jgi:hypothetical protein